MPIERVPRADLQHMVHKIESGGGLITGLVLDGDEFVIAWAARPEGARETRVAEWLTHPWPQQVLAMRAEDGTVHNQRGDAA